MSEQDFNIIFSKNLRAYLSDYNMTQAELADRIGVSTQSVSNWCKGTKSPRMDKVDAMCSIFNCRRSDLIQDHHDTQDAYYLNPQTRDIAQQIYDNKELSLLFDAAKDASPEDLETVHTMLLALKSKEKHGN